MTLSSMEIRYVEWLDSAGLSRWTPIKELQRRSLVSRCLSVGFVLKEDDDQVTLLQSLDPGQLEGDDDNGDNTITIPKIAITASTILREAT